MYQNVVHRQALCGLRACILWVYMPRIREHYCRVCVRSAGICKSH